MIGRLVEPLPQDSPRALRRGAVAWALLAVLGTGVAFAADAASPGREFSATFDFQGEQGNRRMDASILIDRLTPVEEARQLREVLRNQGQSGLVAALRGRRNGQLRIGALDFSLDLVVAKPTEDGFLLLIVTTRPIRLEETLQGSDSAGHPFGVVSVEIDGFGRGEGRFFPRAALAIDANGAVTVQQAVEGEGRVTGVKKVR
jgi:hypothetical protein